MVWVTSPLVWGSFCTCPGLQLGCILHTPKQHPFLHSFRLLTCACHEKSMINTPIPHSRCCSSDKSCRGQGKRAVTVGFTHLSSITTERDSQQCFSYWWIPGGPHWKSTMSETNTFCTNTVFPLYSWGGTCLHSKSSCSSNQQKWGKMTSAWWQHLLKSELNSDTSTYIRSGDNTNGRKGGGEVKE